MTSVFCDQKKEEKKEKKVEKNKSIHEQVHIYVRLSTVYINTFDGRPPKQINLKNKLT